ncbi:MAG: phosphate ABC transporter permease PstA [Bdellovibrionales bacterium]|nr:phosphate ABC transporter permease PstA [Bdellovibrionales bacterium]
MEVSLQPAAHTTGRLRDRLSFRDFGRKWKNRGMRLLLLVMAIAAIAPLLSVFIYVFQQGGSSLNWSFFSEVPVPVGETGGGMLNAWVGTVTIVLMASVVGIPWGIAAGIYLSEYGKGKLGNVLRFATDILTSVPSIIIGLFAYAIIVVPLKRFSAHAGAAALAVIMVPFVTRTTEELLKLVPNHVREAGLALGLPRWKVVLWIVLRGSAGGIMTGVMLAVARVAGETAPLLFTAFGNRFLSLSLDQPMATLPVQIYTYAISPYEEWHRQAWAGAFVLVIFVFTLNLFTRLIMARRR